MKKKIMFGFELIISIIFFEVGKKYEKKRIYEQNKSKLKQADINLKWIKLYRNHQKISEWLFDRGYRNIAIYGLGNLGIELIDELKENQVQIKYIIDQRADEIFHEKYEVFKYSSKLPKVDLIIMTVINDEEEIKNRIKYELDCDVYSLDEILDEMLIVGE